MLRVFPISLLLWALIARQYRRMSGGLSMFCFPNDLAFTVVKANTSISLSKISLLLVVEEVKLAQRGLNQ